MKRPSLNSRVKLKLHNYVFRTSEIDSELKFSFFLKENYKKRKVRNYNLDILANKVSYGTIQPFLRRGELEELPDFSNNPKRPLILRLSKKFISKLEKE